MQESELRSQMCEVGSRLWQRGLIGACEGNITCRLDAGRLLATPAGLSKGHLCPDDLVVIDLEGNSLGHGSPSSEIKLHLIMYKLRPDCEAVVHAHPPIATALTLIGEGIPDNVLPEAAYVLGSVASVGFTMPGTEEVPNSVAPLLADHKTFLLSHHGAATMGANLMDAYNRMETLERVARVIFCARQMGSIKPMPDRAFQQMIKVALNGSL